MVGTGCVSEFPSVGSSEHGGERCSGSCVRDSIVIVGSVMARRPAGVSVVRWQSPSVERARKGVAKVAEEDDVKQPKEQLLAAYQDMCKGFHVRQCAKITTPVKHLKICFVALRCLCGTPQTRELMRFVRCLQVALVGTGSRGGILDKGSAGRSLYTSARLCLRVHRKGKASMVRNRDVVFHLGYGNLSTGLFYVLQLEACVATVFQEGMARIRLRAIAVPIHFWDLFAELPLDRDLDIQGWSLYDGDEPLGSSNFHPGDCDLQLCEPRIERKLWRTEELIRLPLPGPRRGAGAGPGVGAPEPVEDWTVEDPGEPPSELETHVAEVTKQVAAMHRRTAVHTKSKPAKTAPPTTYDPWVPIWDVVTSDSDDGGGGDGGDRGDGGPRPNGKGEGKGAGGKHKRKREEPPDMPPLSERGPWDQIHTAQARFILDPYKMSIGCHCTEHKDCTFNRVAVKQPIGVFKAWLDLAKLPAHNTKEKHCAVKKQTTTLLAYGKRCDGRTSAEADAEWQPLFKWEVPERGAEPVPFL